MDWMEGIRSLDRDALAWAIRFDDPVRAWSRCTRADWMMAVAVNARAPRSMLVRWATDCAALALPLVPIGEERPTRCLEAALAWAEGRRAVSERNSAFEGGEAASVALEGAPQAAAAAARNVSRIIGGRRKHARWAVAAVKTAFAAASNARDISDADWEERLGAVRVPDSERRQFFPSRAAVAAQAAEERAERLMADAIRARRWKLPRVDVAALQPSQQVAWDYVQEDVPEQIGSVRVLVGLCFVPILSVGDRDPSVVFALALWAAAGPDPLNRLRRVRGLLGADPDLG